MGSQVHYFLKKRLTLQGKINKFNQKQYRTMKKSNIFAILILLSVQVFSQSNYNDYSISSKAKLFYDDFNNNDNKWIAVSNDKKQYKIDSGYYSVQSKNKYGKIVRRTISIDNSKDFEIEAKMKILKDDNINDAHLLHWGGTSGKQFEFGFNLNGKYIIGKYDASLSKGDKFISYVNWPHSPDIVKNDFNKLTIRKVKNYYYFFINEKLVHKMPFVDFFGNKMGVKCSSNSILQVDYMYVSYLEKNAGNYPPQIVITEPETNESFKISADTSIRVAGRATDTDGIYEVTVNGVNANLQSNGYFSVDIPCSVGDSVIYVKAVDNKMQLTTKIFELNRKNENVSMPPKKRVALVFGNSNYENAANLGVNPINDASDIAATLKTLDFHVTIKTDADLTTMNNAIREFGRQNKNADIALFYFAGHGIQVEHVNYLLPVEVDIQDKNDVVFECVNVNTVQKIMETSNSKRLNLIILDACRNNPFKRWLRGGEEGLADMTPPSGTLIAFATSPGETSSNGYGRNGLYTGELIKQLKKPQRIEDVFINTRIEVENKSNGKQSPWELARLRGKYFLVKKRQ